MGRRDLGIGTPQTFAAMSPTTKLLWPLYNFKLLWPLYNFTTTVRWDTIHINTLPIPDIQANLYMKHYHTNNNHSMTNPWRNAVYKCLHGLVVKYLSRLSVPLAAVRIVHKFAGLTPINSCYWVHWQWQWGCDCFISCTGGLKHYPTLSP